MSEQVPEPHWRALCACGWIMRGPRDVVGPAAVRHADEGSHAPVRVEEIRHPRPATAATISFTFDPVQVFPPGDRLTTPLLRLMLAADDVRLAQRLMLEASERLRVATGTQAKLLTGEYWYALRLLCSHLHEAIDGFRTLTGSVSPDQIKRVLVGQAEALAAFEALRAGTETDKLTRMQTFIFKARTSIGSHYDNEAIKRLFAKYAERYLEGFVTASDVGGLTRFTLTDGLAILLLLDAAGADLPPAVTTEAEAAKFRTEIERALQASADEMLPLAGALTTFVDSLAYTLVQQRGYTKREEATIEVPQLLRAAGETPP
jgi:hypothetical protein